MKRSLNWVYGGFDVLAWCIATLLAVALRYDVHVSAAEWKSAGLLLVAAVLLQLIFGYVFYLYRGRHRWGSFEAVREVALTAATTGLSLWIITFLFVDHLHLSRTIAPIATGFALLLMFFSRYMGRLIASEHLIRAKQGKPVILIGAGYVGEHLARRLTTDSNAELMPVAFLDDDPDKANLRLCGVRVRGTIQDLPKVAHETGATQAIVALAQPSPSLLRDIQAQAKLMDLKVMMMPPLEQVLRYGLSENRLRDLSIEDLLGRSVVDTNVEEIAEYLSGKRVLVTGARGSIGSQLCAEITKHNPSELIMLDRDETGLQQTQLKVRGNGLLDSNEVVLADIRDREALEELFLNRRPDVVFHAAALKHLPMLEQYPDEAWKTNVLGTYNVLCAADRAGVKTFINVSTDKAADPISILGLSKRLAERLTSWMGQQNGGRYLSVRFGNVIGSRGSMLPTFHRLIEEGKPLTVTHPDVTRYFMTIPEACQLVLQAGGIGRVGEVLILDMGEPVRILDIAEQMIALSGKDIEIVFTGLREGEKLDEVLHSHEELEDRPFHPKISHVHVEGLAPSELTHEMWQGLVLLDPIDRKSASLVIGERVSH